MGVAAAHDFRSDRLFRSGFPCWQTAPDGAAPGDQQQVRVLVQQRFMGIEDNFLFAFMGAGLRSRPDGGQPLTAAGDGLWRPVPV